MKNIDHNQRAIISSKNLSLADIPKEDADVEILEMF